MIENQHSHGSTILTPNMLDYLGGLRLNEIILDPFIPMFSPIDPIFTPHNRILLKLAFASDILGSSE